MRPTKPFFVYYVPGGTHAPHHPTQEWIEKISAMHLFDDGWEKLRETIFANQKRLGIMPENAQLTPWPDGQEALRRREAAPVGLAQLGAKEALHQASGCLWGVPGIHRS